MFIISSEREHGRAAGIAVRGDGHRHAPAAQFRPPEAGRFRRAHRRRRAAARRRCPDAASAPTPAVDVYSRWSADRAPYRAARAAPPPSDSWSACSFTGRPSSRARWKMRSTWAPREGDGLAEGVHGVDEALGGQRRERLVADERHVVVGAAGKPGRHRVRAQVGGPDADAGLPAELPGRAQHAALGVEIEAVAGLDLDRRDAALHEARQPRPGSREQLVRAGRAGRGHRGLDAAAQARDLLVAGAVPARLELRQAVAGEDEVGMAVDEARASARRRPGGARGRRSGPGLPAGPAAVRPRRCARRASQRRHRESRHRATGRGAIVATLASIQRESHCAIVAGALRRRWLRGRPLLFPEVGDSIPPRAVYTTSGNHLDHTSRSSRPAA